MYVSTITYLSELMLSHFKKDKVYDCYMYVSTITYLSELILSHFKKDKVYDCYMYVSTITYLSELLVWCRLHQVASSSLHLIRSPSGCPETEHTSICVIVLCDMYILLLNVPVKQRLTKPMLTLHITHYINTVFCYMSM